MMRRTHLAIELPDGGYDAAPGVAELIGEASGWSEAEAARQVQTYRDAVAADREALEKVQAGL